MIVKCEKCKANDEIQLPDWGVVNTSTCRFCGYVMQLIPIKGLGSLEEITDTDRLNLLLSYIDIDNGYTNEGEKSVFGPVVNGDSIEEELWNKGFESAMNKELDAIKPNRIPTDVTNLWKARVLRAAIDEIIRKERER